ncbi:MAG: DoxX family protein [Planctomycetota bacterium]|jgi:putative oxidoreductase
MAKGGKSNWGTLVPRFLLALIFVFHGGRSLFGLFGGGGLPELEALITTWDWPAPGILARAAAAAAFFGGLCLLIGLLTRFWSLTLIVLLGVSAWKIQYPNGFAVMDGGWEYQFVLAVLCLWLFLQGGGAFSVDEMFFSKKKAPKPKDP